MRMWNTPPRLLCRQHLLGEHKEMHMFVGAFRRRISLYGYIEGGMLETWRIKERHDELVLEMEHRGYNHFSPIDLNPTDEVRGRVDVFANLKELAKRCSQCALLQKEEEEAFERHNQPCERSA